MNDQGKLNQAGIGMVERLQSMATNNPIVYIIIALIIGAGGYTGGRYSTTGVIENSAAEIAVLKEKVNQLCDMKAEIIDIKRSVGQIEVIKERLNNIVQRLEEISKKQSLIQDIQAINRHARSEAYGALCTMPE